MPKKSKSYQENSLKNQKIKLKDSQKSSRSSLYPKMVMKLITAKQLKLISISAISVLKRPNGITRASMRSVKNARLLERTKNEGAPSAVESDMST
jgi:hypothetical protein